MSSGAYKSLEKTLLRASFVLFLILHVVALLSIPLFSPVAVPPEISIDIDLLPDTALFDPAPVAEKSKEVNMLPQLPKKYVLQKPRPFPVEPEPAPELADNKPEPQPQKDKPLVEEKVANNATNEENLLKINALQVFQDKN